MASVEDPKLLFTKNECTKSKEDPNICLAKGEETYNDGKGWIRRVEIGKKHDWQEKEKVIMIVGETGSGKTTLINAMFNHIIGVDWKDDYRVKLIEEEEKDQAHSVTSCLTAYTIHHQPWFKSNFALTIIDTPGLGDTKGITRDEEIAKQIEKFFRMDAPQGIDRLDAVGFVAQSGRPRLTPTQMYIFDKVLSPFAKDIADVIFMFLTFDDGNKPKTLDAIKAAEIPYQKHFLFNNGGVYNIDHENNMQGIFWESARKNFKTFFDQLDAVEPTSLTLTREVIDERKRLEDAIQMIETNITWNTRTLEELDQERNVLKDHQKDIDKKKHFTYKVYGQYSEREPLPEGHKAINCNRCNVTCYKTTTPRWNSENLGQCWLFHEASCRRCTGSCKPSDHQVESFAFVLKRGLIDRTLSDLRETYDDGQGAKQTAKRFLEVSKKKIADVREQTLELYEEARSCIDRLDEIALRPNSMSISDHIDIVIENEKTKSGEDLPPLEKRLAPLQALKRRATIRERLVKEKQAKKGEESATREGLVNEAQAKKGEESVKEEKDKRKVGFLSKIKGKFLKMTHRVEQVRQPDGTINYTVRKVY